MYGGIAVSRNLLCLTYTAGCGRVFLVDLEEKRPVDFWEFGGDDGAHADAGGVAVDDNFILYVADTHNEVLRRFTAFGKELPSFGSPHVRPPGSTLRDRPGSLERPHAVAAHEGVIRIVCGEHPLRRGVQQFTTEGELLPPLQAFGSPQGEFGAPRGICAGADGIFVADTLHGVVQRFTPDGRYVCQVNTAPSTHAISRPVAVQSLGDGTILVIDQGDQDGLRRLDIRGGSPVPVALAGVVVDPVGLARDESGRIYVLDRDGERVLKLDVALSGCEEVLDVAEFLHQ